MYGTGLSVCIVGVWDTEYGGYRIREVYMGRVGSPGRGGGGSLLHGWGVLEGSEPGTRTRTRRCRSGGGMAVGWGWNGGVLTTPSAMPAPHPP